MGVSGLVPPQMVQADPSPLNSGLLSAKCGLAGSEMHALLPANSRTRAQNKKDGDVYQEKTSWIPAGFPTVSTPGLALCPRCLAGPLHAAFSHTSSAPQLEVAHFVSSSSMHTSNQTSPPVSIDRSPANLQTQGLLQMP